jgi:hypothetical protein
MNINDIIIYETHQLDEIDWKGIQKKAAGFQQGAQNFTKNVADTGAAVGGAASALGGAAKEVGKQLIAKPVAATYGAAKSGLSKVADVTKGIYGDVKKGVQTGAQGIGTAASDIVGGTAGAIGSVAGGATTGVGRAAVKGFQSGAQSVGGAPAQRGQGVFATTPAATTPAQSFAPRAAYSYNYNTPAIGTTSNTATTAKQSVDSALSAINKLKGEDRAAAMQYAKDKIFAVGEPSAVTEALTWSRKFDPGMTLYRRMKQEQK